MSNNKKYVKSVAHAPTVASAELVDQTLPMPEAAEALVDQVLLPPPEVAVTEDAEEPAEIEGLVAETNSEKDLEPTSIISLSVPALDYIMILCAQYIGMAAYAGLSEDIVKAIEDGKQVVVVVDPLRVVITDQPFVPVDLGSDVGGAGCALHVNRKLSDARMLD